VSFPHAAQDSFLYLLLGGGKSTFSPFGSERSVFDAFLFAQNSCKLVLQGTAIGHSNPLALHRDGEVYESLATLATEIASHKGGVGGINIVDFLFQSTCQLLPFPSRPSGWDPDWDTLSSLLACPQGIVTKWFPF
jgi:hypothetical protein